MKPSLPQDQDEIFAFLADPASHKLDHAVVRIDTHGACVFLAGADVYKVKRAVRFDFMDFSTLEKRRLACEREIAVNKANAPELYIGVVPIGRSQGGLRLGAPGDVVEWAVHMRRFDENNTLDRLADRGEFSVVIIPKLAGAVLKSHLHAAVRHCHINALDWYGRDA